jgi:hypothetical protein
MPPVSHQIRVKRSLTTEPAIRFVVKQTPSEAVAAGSIPLVYRPKHLRVVVCVLAVGVATSLVFNGVASSTPEPRTASALTPRLGIDLVLDGQDLLNDSQVAIQALKVFQYIKSLHANSVSLNFPFFMTSSTSNSPERWNSTPSPARVAEITNIARKFRLSVLIRPYLSYSNLKPPARSRIDPSDPPLWFANYWKFLQPYLVAAKQSGAESFSIAMENASLLSDIKDWLPLVRKAKAVFGDQIYYSSNHAPFETIPMTKFGYDDYQPILLNSDAQATVANLTVGFESNLTTPGFPLQPADTTLEELWIAAMSGAYRHPNDYEYPPGTRIERSIQANWFTAACNAFWHFHMPGIYFWAVYFEGFNPSENDTDNIGGWMNTASQKAIVACFSRTS